MMTVLSDLKSLEEKRALNSSSALFLTYRQQFCTNSLIILDIIKGNGATFSPKGGPPKYIIYTLDLIMLDRVKYLTLLNLVITSNCFSLGWIVEFN